MAQRIQFKRSSIAGRRPASQYLEPGEIALNTNQADPGLFFETNTGGIAKVGPAFIGTQPPASDVGYGPGEQWLDAGNGTLNLWVPAINQWVSVQSPLFGGATTAIFVGSEFPEASDDLSNDGIARPFATLNRAMMEVARRSILAGRSDDVYNARFSVVLLPGRNIVYNEPGVDMETFEGLVSGFAADQPLPQPLLRLFNPVTGGLLVPRGTSIFAFDLRKTEIRPTYYPIWTTALYAENPDLIEPRTSILKWTGNSYFYSFTFKDKVSEVSVDQIYGAADEAAVLHSLRPHGYRTLVTTGATPDEIVAGDTVILTYPQSVSRLYNGVATISPGTYYVEPITPYTFRLRTTEGTLILRNQLPEIGVPGAAPPEFLTLTRTLTTHHRLSALDFAETVELDNYYSKVQRAFSLLNFAGTVNNAEVAPGETTIVANTPQSPTVAVDDTKNSSPYIFNCSLRSNYGMCGATVNGDLVAGFKSALFCNFTSVSLQNDADVYEVYESTSSSWISLKQAYADSFTPALDVVDVTNDQAIQYMLSSSVSVGDIRYFYRPAPDISGQAGKSSGLPSELTDTRHYAVLCENDGFCQIVASFAIGVAVNYWAKGGGSISVTNANSNFGGIALRAEGFSGIGTTGGAQAPNKGFTIQGIRRPEVVTKQMVQDPLNIKRFFFNARIASTTTTTIVFDQAVDTSALLPYTLRAGTFVWVEDYSTGITYKAQIVSTGEILSSNGLTLNVQSSGNQIHSAVSGGISVDSLSLPYLRRFVDPRPDIDKTYSLYLQNTQAGHASPQVGYVIRYEKDASVQGAGLIKSTAQLDPGSSGGWGHIFQVIDSRTAKEGNNPNGVEPLIAPLQTSQNYYVTLSPVDGFRPWIASGDNGFSTGVTVDYPRGYYSTYGTRPFYATKNDEAAAASKPVPTNSNSVWLRSKNFEYCQPVTSAWIGSADVPYTADPFTSSYPAGATYPRGLQYDRTNPGFNNVIDLDDGTATLGILNTTGNTGLAQPELYDPWWQPTKQAMTRFLHLLGYSYAQIATMLTPQLWTSRNLLVSAMPNPSSADGYATQKGNWPVAFNQPSTIRCGNHTWEWAGYITYGKGLPQYQTSQLSLRERFDAMSMEVWGGIVYANGNTEQGEFMITGKTVAGGTGTTLLNTNILPDFYATQDVTA